MSETKEKVTKKEAEEKWDKLPGYERDRMIKAFGEIAKPMWVKLAQKCGFTKIGKEL